MDLAKISRMALEYSDAKDTGAYIGGVWNQLTVEESRALFREIERRRNEFSDFCR
jgi:hypothetical protein